MHWSNGSTGRLVVVLEDDVFLRELIIEILHEGGRYDLVGVADVESCLEVVRSTDVALIVSDVSLGLARQGDLRKLLQEIRGGHRVRVAFLSALSDAELERLGIERYLAKPFDVADFLVFVEESLNRPLPD